MRDRRFRGADRDLELCGTGIDLVGEPQPTAPATVNTTAAARSIHFLID